MHKDFLEGVKWNKFNQENSYMQVFNCLGERILVVES